MSEADWIMWNLFGVMVVLTGNVDCDIEIHRPSDTCANS